CVVDVSIRDVIGTEYAYNDYYHCLVAARMIDVETGLVVSAAGLYNTSISYDGRSSIPDLDKLITISKDIAAKLLKNVTTTADKPKMAIYVTQSSNTFYAKCASSHLIEKITNNGIYITVERTSDFLAGLRREQNYQHSGNVDDSQISRLGRQFGVDMVCVIDIAEIDGYNYTTVRIIDVETGLIAATAEEKGIDMDYITAELIKQLGNCTKKDQPKNDFMVCCEGLTLINGICRDIKDNSAYWLKERLGLDVMLHDVRVKAEDIINKKESVCPAGWRMPTKDEFTRILKVKDELNLKKTGYSDYYITSDFRISKYKKDYHYYQVYGTEWSERSIFETNNKKDNYYDNYKTYYCRCVRD
ncbi:MAG: hypothetical protein LBQ28_10030, partial [Prevotellaceae bacterium]|nr:hypothetical protein [Prevotellaceae bacterium]